MEKNKQETLLKTPTGISGLDEITNGRFPKGSPLNLIFLWKESEPIVHFYHLLHEGYTGHFWFGTWQGISIYDGNRFMNAKESKNNCG